MAPTLKFLLALYFLVIPYCLGEAVLSTSGVDSLDFLKENAATCIGNNYYYDGAEKIMSDALRECEDEFEEEDHDTPACLCVLNKFQAQLDHYKPDTRNVARFVVKLYDPNLLLTSVDLREKLHRCVRNYVRDYPEPNDYSRLRRIDKVAHTFLKCVDPSNERIIDRVNCKISQLLLGK